MPDERGDPPYKVAGATFLAILAAAGVLIAMQFRGAFIPHTQLTLLTSRAGLVLDPGSKVTLNGVPIGRVATVAASGDGQAQQATITLNVEPRYVPLIPSNVDVKITATTVFGNKYVSFISPEHPAQEHVSSDRLIDVTSVTTEFNTLFETITAISEQVDPVKLNQTLTATAQALTGFGDEFGASLADGNDILGNLNPRMPQIRHDVASVADLAAVYADASPNLFDGLAGAVTTARTINDRRDDIDAALMAAVGFAGTATDVLDRGGPYLVRGAADLLRTSKLADDYQAEILCTIRNYHDVAPRLNQALGGDNGFSLETTGTISGFFGVGNPYVYPDNLPRVNAHGGPEGKPGCWQEITRDLWPVPYLVMDTGISIAPYNHFELAQPLYTDYVWGRQIGEPTINP